MEKHKLNLRPHTSSTIKTIIFFVLFSLLLPPSLWVVNAQSGDPDLERNAETKTSIAISRFDTQEFMRVIVQLRVPDISNNPEGMTPDIQAAQGELMSTLNGFNYKMIHSYNFIPFMAVEVDQVGFEELLRSPLVVSVEEDILMQPLLAESVPLINADDVWSLGYTGAGQVVAVLDTGVDKNHPALAGKVVSEACYSTTSTTSNPPTTSLCPGGVSATTVEGSALPYISNCPIGKCDHGTHVAGIVAAKTTTYNGVAKDANIIAMQVFSRVDSTKIGSWSSDQIKGLERVYDLRNTYSISAVNLSLGGPPISATACDASNLAYKSSVDKLRTAGIVTIAASGNDGYSLGISSPACISSVVSVGATTDYGVETVASFSNSASILDLLAPGEWITSSVPGTSYGTWSGTSMAAPHVAGAWALMRSADPTISVDSLLNTFKNSGFQILDTRNGLIKPRIDVFSAVKAILAPEIPVNVIATDGTFNDRVEISWNLADHATYYQIFRNSKDSASNATLIKDNQTTSPYTDSTALPGTIYFYWVKGCNSAGCSEVSLSDPGWIGTAELTSPTSVDASDGSFNDRVRILWNGVGGADFYRVYRNEVNDPNSSLIIADSVETLVYDDILGSSTIERGKDYYYWLQACKTQGMVCSAYSTMDIGFINDQFNLYLPLMLKNTGDISDPIKNGNFEKGSDGSWTEYSSNAFDLIVPKEQLLVSPRSGNWAVWLGGEIDEISRLSQTIPISSARPYLHYWYWIGSEDICGYDYFRLKVNSTILTQTELCSPNSTTSWRENVVNLSAYAGSTVTIMFEVTNDDSLNSNFFLDDVSMSNVSTASTAVLGETQMFGDVTGKKVK